MNELLSCLAYKLNYFQFKLKYKYQQLEIAIIKHF